MLVLTRRVGGAGILVPLLATPAQSAVIDGTASSPIWGLPFIGLLLSLLLLPLFVRRTWHRQYGNTAIFWAFAFLAAFAFVHGIGNAAHVALEVVLRDYLPLIIMMLAFFTIAGGVRIVGNLHGSPSLNTGLLTLGMALASWIGTIAAAMLLIRPLIRANDNRRHSAHIFIFFIYLVANIGGALTPLGAPPLFLGFLNGVRFFWTMEALFLPTLLTSMLLLAIFYLVDRFYYIRDGVTRDPTPDTPIRVEGGINIFLLAGAIGIVVLSESWRLGNGFDIAGIGLAPENLARDAILIALAVLSLLLTRRGIRKDNGFKWAPFLLIAKFFAGLFIVAAPVIAILRTGSEGSMNDLLALLPNDGGMRQDWLYFWLTGLLAAFLNNAPAYLAALNMTGHTAAALMDQMTGTLLAISMGAVYLGAATYIGNAANFMVKAIAEDMKIEMPGFFGYMLWSGVILVPVCGLVAALFLWV